MSNPGKRGEIEDVLSAIRRLLAEDTSGEGQAAVRAAGERLLLTQEYRATERPEEEEGEPAPSIEDALAALEAAVAARATPLRAVEAEPVEPHRQVEEAPFIAIEEPESQPSETLSFRLGAMRRFQLVRTSFSSTTEPGEEEKDDSAPAVEAARPPGVEEVPEPQPVEVPAETPEETPSVPPAEEPIELPEDLPETPPQELPGETDALPAEGEAYLPVDVRDDLDACGEPEAASPPVEAEAEAEAEAEDAYDPEQDDWDDEEETLFAEELPVFDPEALRLMVAEILREELQGPLGERMTRNVRKLVRSEIRRALTGRELE